MKAGSSMPFPLARSDELTKPAIFDPAGNFRACSALAADSTGVMILSAAGCSDQEVVWPSIKQFHAISGSRVFMRLTSRAVSKSQWASSCFRIRSKFLNVSKCSNAGVYGHDISAVFCSTEVCIFCVFLRNAAAWSRKSPADTLATSVGRDNN